MEEYHKLIKICLFADSDVGQETLAKSNFLKRLFENYYIQVKGVEFATKRVEHSGKIIVQQIWIMSDDKKSFQSTWKNYLIGSNGVILMYDITNAKTLSMVSEWCQMVKNIGEEIPILLVGNKSDLEENREVSKEQVEKLKVDYNISSSLEISLKTGENVEEMFRKLAGMIVKKVEETNELKIEKKYRKKKRKEKKKRRKLRK